MNWKGEKALYKRAAGPLNKSAQPLHRYYAPLKVIKLFHDSHVFRSYYSLLTRGGLWIK